MATPSKAGTVNSGKQKNSLSFKGIRSELKKVSWPNKKELGNHTTVVIVFCAITAIGIFIADTVFLKGLSFL